MQPCNCYKKDTKKKKVKKIFTTRNVCFPFTVYLFKCFVHTGFLSGRLLAVLTFSSKFIVTAGW